MIDSPYFEGEIAGPGIAIPLMTRKLPLGDTWLDEVVCNGIKGCWDFSFLEAAWQGSRRRSAPLYLNLRDHVQRTSLRGPLLSLFARGRHCSAIWSSRRGR